MKFHLNYNPVKPDFGIDHSQPVLLLGSCFSENIGAQLLDHKFTTLVHPGGIMFNPISIGNYLAALINNEAAKEELLISKDNIFYSYLHHSSVHSSTKT